MKHLKITSVHFCYLLKSFEEWLEIKGYSSSARKYYPIHIQEFFHFIESTFGIMQIDKINSDHTKTYSVYIQYRTNQKVGYGALSNNSINAKLQALNLFAQYLNTSTDRIVLDVHYKLLPESTKRKTILTQQEVLNLYHSTFDCYPKTNNHQAMGLRDRVIIGVFYSCGLRLSEGRALNLNDIDYQNSRLLIRKGKGNKQRYLPIPSKTLQDFKDYVQMGRDWFLESHQYECKYARKKIVTDDDQQAFILNQSGKRMKKFDFRLNYLTKKTSIDKQIGTHTLRHSVATHLLQGGMDIEKISQLLGHTKLDTTQQYVHLLEEQEPSTKKHNERI